MFLHQLKTLEMKRFSRRFTACTITPGALSAIWLCSEDKLGRVGTIQWSSFATAVLILLMALSHGTLALFLPISILTFLGLGEGCEFKFSRAVHPRFGDYVRFSFDGLVRLRNVDNLLTQEEYTVVHEALLTVN